MRLNKLWLEYRGYHQAPDTENGAPLHDLTKIYPEDIYSAEGVRIYGSGEPYDYQAIAIIRQARGKPNLTVKVYRAVPKLPDMVKIGAGDWVTICREYAILHGRSSLRGSHRILTMTVRAKELYTEGNSIHEWGYNPARL